MIKSTETKNLKMMDKSPLTNLREDWETFKPDRVPRAGISSLLQTEEIVS